MRKVNIHEAKTHLSRLVEQAAKGEAIIIAKAGKPMAQLTPIPEIAGAHRNGWLGAMAGKFHIPDDFDRMDEDEIARLFGAAD
jgi:prevent-host-death family protein